MNIMMAISAFSHVLKLFSQKKCEIAWRLQRLFILLQPKVDISVFSPNEWKW